METHNNGSFQEFLQKLFSWYNIYRRLNIMISACSIYESSIHRVVAYFIYNGSVQINDTEYWLYTKKCSISS